MTDRELLKAARSWVRSAATDGPDSEAAMLLDQIDAAPPAGDDARDAARYRWLRGATWLVLKTERIKWVRPDGSEFYSSHFLQANGMHKVVDFMDRICLNCGKRFGDHPDSEELFCDYNPPSLYRHRMRKFVWMPSAIAAPPSDDAWISVDVRRPPIHDGGDDVPVWTWDGESVKEDFYLEMHEQPLGFGGWQSIGWGFLADGGGRQATHWMPRPTPEPPAMRAQGEGK